MPRKIGKGATIVVRGEVSRVGDNGMITFWIPGYEIPITIHERYFDSVQPAPKEPKPRFKRKFYDKPT